MDESEYALHNASDSPRARVSRIANTIIHDSRCYRHWELQHANLLLPVAAQNSKKGQLSELRNAEIQLVHRRALFDFLREGEIRGEERRQLFRVFHSTIDYDAAVLVEHRQYMLAVSSHISAKHLIGVMNDPNTRNLLNQYKILFARYFEMKCYVAGMGDSQCIDLVRSAMGDTRDQLRRLRHRIETAAPQEQCGSFDRQEALARSGRYPVLNYMVG